MLPALIGLFGIIMIWRRDWRLGAGLTLLFLSASLVTILLLNVPENFFRDMDRHYLPSFVIFAIWTGFGAAALLRSICRTLARNERKPGALVFIVVLLLLWLVGNQFLMNRDAADRSNRFFAEDFGRNLLSMLPPDAILITAGDNDTYPLWYLQGVMRFRPDVTVLNLHLLNTPWFLEQSQKRRPALPLGLTVEEMRRLRPVPWQDTIVAIAAPPGQTRSSDTSMAAGRDSIYLRMTPTAGDRFLMPQDWVLLNIVKENRWRLPLYVAATVSRSAVPWLQPYLQQEGLAARMVATRPAAPATSLIRYNLVRRYHYRGYSDPDVFIDDVSRNMALNYYSLFRQLAEQEVSAGRTEECQRLTEHALELLPPERLGPPGKLVEAFHQICENPPAERP
jgi:hypothetical protein